VTWPRLKRGFLFAEDLSVDTKRSSFADVTAAALQKKISLTRTNSPCLPCSVGLPPRARALRALTAVLVYSGSC